MEYAHRIFFRGEEQVKAVPLSPLPFALTIEPLAEAITVHDYNEGIKLGKSIYKIAIYADDILFVSSPETSLGAILKIIHCILALFLVIR